MFLGSFTFDAGLFVPIATPIVSGPTHGECGKWLVATQVRKFWGDIDAYRARYGKAEGEARFFLEHKPYDVVNSVGNMLMVGGGSKIMEALIGNAPTYLNNANAYLGVGDSTTAEARSQTDLQASTNKARVGMDSGKPLHSTGTAVKTITGATNASPIVITSTAHGYSNGDFVHISGVAGNTAANGLFAIQNVAANTFELVGSTGSGAYTSGGDVTKFNAAVWSATFGPSVANFAWNEWGLFDASTGGVMANRKVVSLGTKASPATWQLIVGASVA
jgi:hypothetical protein